MAAEAARNDGSRVRSGNPSSLCQETRVLCSQAPKVTASTSWRRKSRDPMFYAQTILYVPTTQIENECVR